MRDHDRFLNQMIALGGHLRFFLKHYTFEDGDDGRCRRGIEIASAYVERFRDMSPWRRWLFDAVVWLLVR